MVDFNARVDYRVGVGALILAFLLALVVWIIAYIEYRKLQRQRRINNLIKRIREREEDSGNESDGDLEELSTMVDMGNIRLMDGV
nr:vpu protein [Human immunodeficiency virus 1]UTT72014.1 vpu protein [Human immunodeficiency virus 1]